MCGCPAPSRLFALPPQRNASKKGRLRNSVASWQHGVHGEGLSGSGAGFQRSFVVTSKLMKNIVFSRLGRANPYKNIVFFHVSVRSYGLDVACAPPKKYRKTNSTPQRSFRTDEKHDIRLQRFARKSDRLGFRSQWCCTKPCKKQLCFAIVNIIHCFFYS